MHFLQGYFAGGAGYVLSREALRRFVVDGITNSSICEESDKGDEDVNLGKIILHFVCISYSSYILFHILGGCMRNLNVTHGDSRDDRKLKRFFPFEPRDHLIPSMYLVTLISYQL